MRQVVRKLYSRTVSDYQEIVQSARRFDYYYYIIMLPANRLCAAPSPLFFAFVRRIIGEDRQFAVPSWQFGLTKLSKLHRRPRVHLVARSRYVNNILDFNFHILPHLFFLKSRR